MRRSPQEQAADRQAILQKCESLLKLFPEEYAPDVSVFTDAKVEIMFKLTYEQAQNLARLIEGAYGPFFVPPTFIVKAT